MVEVECGRSVGQCGGCCRMMVEQKSKNWEKLRKYVSLKWQLMWDGAGGAGRIGFEELRAWSDQRDRWKLFIFKTKKWIYEIVEIVFGNPARNPWSVRLIFPPPRLNRIETMPLKILQPEIYTQTKKLRTNCCSKLNKREWTKTRTDCFIVLMDLSCMVVMATQADHINNNSAMAFATTILHHHSFIVVYYSDNVKTNNWANCILQLKVFLEKTNSRLVPECHTDTHQDQRIT